MKKQYFLFSLVSLFILTSFYSKAQSENDKVDNSDIVYVCPPCNNDCDNLKFTKPGICPHCNMKLITEQKLEKVPTSKRKKIAFYLQSGVEVLDFAGPMEVFSYAGYEVFTVSKTKDPIISQGILKIIPDYSIADAPPADILAFFGGNGGPTSKDKAVINWVKSQNKIEHYFSVCTGAFILAEAGILEGKTATTFHSALDNLERNFPDTKVLKDVRFVDNGQVITTAGISAGIDGALHLVAKFQGFNKAREVAYHMEYDKWTPGEGLILSDDNPYLDLATVSQLNDFLGIYEFDNGEEIEIKMNQREQSIFAKLGKRGYPLFYLEGDDFLNLSNHKITFIRDNNNIVTGYKTSKYEGNIYKKLKNQ